MIGDGFHVTVADWNADLAELRRVREQVFVIEQGVPVEDEWDALDEASRHVLARDDAGRAIGTGRLTPERRIGRMAVLGEWRGRGVGAALLQALLDLARERGFEAVELHAQSHALPFYERFGFEPFGERFDECGIEHLAMRRALEPFAARESAAPVARPEERLLKAADWAEALAATNTLLDEARREIAIWTRDLDPALYDAAEPLERLKRIALAGRGARVRIIVLDPRAPIAGGHRLIALAQRLSSRIEVRVPGEEQEREYPGAFLLNDRAGYFFRTDGSRPNGAGSTCNPGRHAQLLGLFDAAWERALPCGELRVLGI
ncbi:MAG: GNAT family N-acetyltransferase [Xanthomonadales bacterium]|nr:GNAT family N-acetyltransferase [Xanthomonadales bacterium]